MDLYVLLYINSHDDTIGTTVTNLKLTCNNCLVLKTVDDDLTINITMSLLQGQTTHCQS